MLNYLEQVCQIIFPKMRRAGHLAAGFLKGYLCIILLITTSCSSFNSKEEKKSDNQVVFVKLNTFKTTPGWFETINKKYRLDNSEQNESTLHEFFDVNPALDKDNNEINFIVLNPRSSTNNYQINLTTGKRYLKNPFCPQEDIWERYKGTVHTPNFTMGLIPKYLNSDGDPQEIIVFGKENYYKDHAINEFHRIKIVGGLVVQKCFKLGCGKNSEWKSNLILVGVDYYDEKYADIKSVESLIKKVDWDYTKAFIENYQGRINIIDKEKPFSKLLGTITAREAVSFLNKYGKFFQKEDLVSLQKSCFIIYDYVEKNVIDAAKNLATSASSQDFIKSFRNFYEQYGNSFYTCSKLVPYGNINLDSRRLWFMSYLVGFFHLNSLDYVYSCNQRSWIYNPLILSTNKKLYDQKELLSKCQNFREIESAFTTIPYMFDQMRINKHDYYRFITYDNIPNGTHQKLFTWIKVESKIDQCAQKNEVRKFFEQEVFPSDQKVDLFHN